MYQKLILVGNIGNIEGRYTPEGKAVVNMSVATNEKRGEYKLTTWVRVTVWGNSAEACTKYLAKGSKVMVEGRLNPDPETGGPKLWGDPPKASFEMTADRVVFLDSRPQEPEEEPAF